MCAFYLVICTSLVLKKLQETGTHEYTALHYVRVVQDTNVQVIQQPSIRHFTGLCKLNGIILNQNDCYKYLGITFNTNSFESSTLKQMLIDFLFQGVGWYHMGNTIDQISTKHNIQTIYKTSSFFVELSQHLMKIFCIKIKLYKTSVDSTHFDYKDRATLSHLLG